MGTLLKENGLLSWQIFDDKSSNIVVKIRFGNDHCGPTTDGQSTETVTAYRRNPPSQVKRDHARVAAHKHQQSAAPRVQTRSMAAVCLQTELELHAVMCDDTDKSECFLNPLAVSCEPSQVIHTNSILSRGCDSLTPCSDALTMCSDTPLQSVAETQAF